MTGLEESDKELDRSLDVVFVSRLHHSMNVASGYRDGNHGYPLPGRLDCSGIGAAPR